ncbi:MAG: hypothetical protein EA399_14765 [Desulfovibrionales bacterium]|nr:MAG: hypothetical protein EA399_14765 [Desulfovibrionales bacterium]
MPWQRWRIPYIFFHRYSSAVIAWAPDDAPSEEQIQAVLDDFEKLAWPGMEPERYVWSAILHREKNGGVHVHIFSARVDLATGKSHNIAPPGWQKDYEALRDFWNHSKGWARPDDPLRARILQPGYKAYLDAARLRQGLAVEPDTRQLITDYLVQRIESGSVRDRDGIVAALHEAGLETPRRGKDHITVLDRESEVRCRLKGAIYEQSWTVGRALEVADRKRAKPDRRIDAQAARRARKKLEEAVVRRAAYNAKRYPVVEKARPDQMVASPGHRPGDLFGHLDRELGTDAILGAPDHVATGTDPGHGAQPGTAASTGRGHPVQPVRRPDLRPSRRVGPGLHGRVPDSSLKGERKPGPTASSQDQAKKTHPAAFPSTITDQASTDLGQTILLLQAWEEMNHDRIGAEISRCRAQVERWVDVTLERAKRADRILEQIVQQRERTIRRAGAQGRIAFAIAEVMTLIEETKSIVQRQLQAMACDLYDVARLDRNDRLQINTWSSENILNAVGRLLVENARGSDIWIRPEPQEHSSLILMETTRNTFDRLLQDGFAPALVVQPLADLYQAWIKTGLAATTPRHHNAITRLIRTRYPRQAPFASNPFSRLTGFKNWRIKDQRPGDTSPLCVLAPGTDQLAMEAEWLKQMALEQLLREKQDYSRNRSGVTNEDSTAPNQISNQSSNGHGVEKQRETEYGLNPALEPFSESDIWDAQPIVLIDADPTEREQEEEQEQEQATGANDQKLKARQKPRPWL